MQCSKCRNESIVYQPYSGQYLCQDHFIDDLEAKAKRAIRVQHGMQPGDSIGVPQTGDIMGRALLFFLQKLTGNRRDVRVVAIPASTTGAGYREMAGSHGITKIAIATTLEDVAASALSDILQGDVEKYFSPGPGTAGTLPRITPFSHIPAEEVIAYARVCGIAGETPPLRKEPNRLHTEVAAMLIEYSRRHPATPHAVLNLCEALARTCTKTSEVSPHGA